MKEIFRCSNCGAVKPRPEARCRQCGYAPAPPPGQHFFDLVLIAAPDNLVAVTLIAKLAEIRASEAKQLLQSLPVVIKRSSDQEELHQAALLLRRIGAELAIEPASDHGHDSSPDRLEERPAAPPPGKKVSPLVRLFPVLIFLIAFGLPAIQNNQAVKDLLRKLTHADGPGNTSLSQVEVVVAARDLPAGHVLQKDDLAVGRIDRQDAPDGAISPLALERLIGTRTISALAENEPILVEDLELPDRSGEL
ncbi:flagella basal body P-ring formation protein FlgA [bacterium]|nr:flagella basal body P-ring formation protein FlgA [candidate division CSSED10-310 bacterium]